MMLRTFKMNIIRTYAYSQLEVLYFNQNCHDFPAS